MSRQRMLDAALAYAAEGLRVFPVKARGKVPLTKNGHLEATTDKDQIRAWWEKHPEANIGLVAGDGLAVLDVDPAAGGRESLALIRQMHGLPQTRVIRTGSGGYHLYFRDDVDNPLPQSAGKIAPGLDVRAGGKGYVVAPPSIHPSGEPYAVEKDRPLEPVPAWLREAAGRPRAAATVDPEEPIAEGGRNQALAALAGAMRRRGMSPEGILAALHAENETRCAPPLEPWEVEQIARSVARYKPDPSADVFVPAAEDEFEADPDASPPTAVLAAPGEVEFSDEATVKFLLPELREKLRYVATNREWRVWSGYKWQRDLVMEHERIVRAHLKRLAIHMQERADNAPSKAEAAPFRRYAARLQSSAGIDAITKLLRAHLACSPEAFDMDPWLLNTPAGVVDLRSGEVTPPSPAQMHGRATNVTPRKGAHPMWDAFLDHITNGDADLKAYLQRWFGYGLSGQNTEKILNVLVGDTDTGKSTLIDVIARLMGDYHDTVSPDAFLSARGDRIPAEFARLPGARMVTAVEPEHGRSWDEKRVKEVTGGDVIEVRFLYGQWFTYRPQFKITIGANSYPELSHADRAMLRRIRIVPIDHQVPPEKQIADLRERLLTEEGPEILHWLLEGCLAWQREGLRPPAAVEVKTREYGKDEDTLAQFIEEQCVVEPEGEVTRQAIYQAWAQWSRSRDERPGGLKAFKRKFEPMAKRLGLRDQKIGEPHARVAGYKGIRLRSAVEDGEI